MTHRIVLHSHSVLLGLEPLLLHLQLLLTFGLFQVLGILLLSNLWGEGQGTVSTCILSMRMFGLSQVCVKHLLSNLKGSR